MRTWEVIFWISAIIPAYVYFGYPLVLLLLRVFIHREVRKAPIEPYVSLLIPAYNEARTIERKIRNSLALDYPAERLEVVVACDGSKDDTPELAARMADGKRVRVLSFPQNRGKIAALNAAVPELRGEIAVFSDAPAMLLPDSVRRIVMNFADPQVGAVSGRYTVVKANEVKIGQSENFYWRYETYLKIQESRIASTLGGHGHLHAIRKSLYPFPAPGTLNDDYVIPISVLAKGYRAVYEPSAVVYEEAREMTGFGRRVRIMAGNVQQLREIRALLAPFQPVTLFFFLSHKGLRLAVPFAMIAAFVANLFVIGSPHYQVLFGLQGLFYAVAMVGAVKPLRPRALLLPFYFCMINAATFFGLYHALTKRRKMSWK